MNSSREGPVLRVSGLAKAYRGRPVLRDLALDVFPGESIAVIGPNGAGKSTFLGCITGDRSPDAGEIDVCGADPFRDLETAARCIGFVPEHAYLYGELTVGELLRFVVEARGPAAPSASVEAERLLELLGMAGTESMLCRELSQGMGRKTAIAAALLHRPRLIVLDEAFNGLDLASAVRFRNELDDRRAAGAAVLLSSHDLRFVADWCDRGVFLAPNGRSEVVAGDLWEQWKSADPLQPDPFPNR